MSVIEQVLSTVFKSKLLPLPGVCLLGAAGLLVACQPMEPPLPGMDLTSARVPLALEGDCTADNGFVEFADEVTNLRAVVTGPGMDEPISAEGPLGEPLVIEGITVGEGRRIALYGESANGAPTWRAIANDVLVEQDSNTTVEMLMARVADLSCPRNLQHRPRAFHTATQLHDGRVLLVGGAETEGDCGGASCLSASQYAEIYDPKTGSHTAVAAALNEPRMFHTATLMPDGRVLVAGGASEAELVAVDANNPFPIRATRVVGTIEVFDPATESFSLVGSDPEGPRVFHAATQMVLGNVTYVLLSGGIDGLNDAGPNDLSNAYYSTTRCSTTGTILCEAWNAMVKPRAGHMSFKLDTGQVVMWGGAVETSNVGERAGWQLEWYQPGGQGFEMMNVAGAPGAERNLFFAAHEQYVDYRVLAAGGLIRNPDGSFTMATLDDNGTEAVVYAYDATAIAPYGGIAVGKPSQPRMALSTPRFMGSAATLPTSTLLDDGTLKTVRRVVIAGGFSSLGMAASSALAIYNEFALTVSPLSVGGQPRTLRQARGGLSAIGIGDGTVLISGGRVNAGGTSYAPASTGEIFADPQDPPEPEN
jgi:hypothetical protein